MEFMISGRNVTVSDRFREYATEKLSKLEPMADKVQRVDAKCSKEINARGAEAQLTVELTVQGRGPVIRAEASATDKFAAFDMAFAKLQERLRRAKDKRKIHHGRHTPQAVSTATGALSVLDSPSSDTTAEAYQSGNELPAGDSPVLIRRKVFPAAPLSLDDAVDNMEMVGHDFYLFIEADTGVPSVVYRRRGWTYGVISLNSGADGQEAFSAEEIRAYRSDDEPVKVEAANA